MPEVIFSGPAGRIEGRYHQGTDPAAPIALILHPHPQFGGTMNSKVVYTLFHAYQRRGFSVLRFNFRGVGRSQGTCDNGLGELSDAAASLDWMQGINPNSRGCWIAGFSFGAWIAMQLLMRRPEIDGFIAVAPPASMFDFSFLAPCPSAGIMIHGGSDDLVPADSVEALATRLSSQRGLCIDFQAVPGADHFFTDRLEELGAEVNTYLDDSLMPQVRAATG